MASTTSPDPDNLISIPQEPPISALVLTLYWLIIAYVVLLFGRFVFDLIVTINRGFRPTGPLLVVAEVVYTSTDPPLRLLRRWIPPLRIGSVGIDLGFTLLLIILLVVAAQLRQL